ncbi:hypothetical protein JX266_011790 [Neoarthrinium moseri]|nr:hypothetical protein JX266_011790 [Neoarthrinium moseri]
MSPCLGSRDDVRKKSREALEGVTHVRTVIGEIGAVGSVYDVTIAYLDERDSPRHPRRTRPATRRPAARRSTVETTASSSAPSAASSAATPAAPPSVTSAVTSASVSSPAPPTMSWDFLPMGSSSPFQRQTEENMFHPYTVPGLSSGSNPIDFQQGLPPVPPQAFASVPAQINPGVAITSMPPNAFILPNFQMEAQAFLAGGFNAMTGLSSNMVNIAPFQPAATGAVSLDATTTPESSDYFDDIKLEDDQDLEALVEQSMNIHSHQMMPHGPSYSGTAWESVQQALPPQERQAQDSPGILAFQILSQYLSDYCGKIPESCACRPGNGLLGCVLHPYNETAISRVKAFLEMQEQPEELSSRESSVVSDEGEAFDSTPTPTSDIQLPGWTDIYQDGIFDGYVDVGGDLGHNLGNDLGGNQLDDWSDFGDLTIQ